MKEINYKHVYCKGTRLKDDILSCVTSIGKIDAIEIAKFKDENHVDISSYLSKISERESSNDKK